ncbi:UNVERIFIED_CONTAM: hypothetical protein PYX00_006788 [Menopon gallinae]|uniref:Uncharacterized protein n=1 Tax=Menopon gallinae TaxID=328185 RepID=A0AAW2HX25_9NEOP
MTMKRGCRKRSSILVCGRKYYPPLPCEIPREPRRPSEMKQGRNLDGLGLRRYEDTNKNFYISTEWNPSLSDERFRTKNCRRDSFICCRKRDSCCRLSIKPCPSGTPVKALSCT